jgi:fluoroquinolone transport system permease protein
VTRLQAFMRWDVALQRRNGFYWATAFIVLVMGGLLLTLPAAARVGGAVWVPPLLAVNLQITTFFFMAGLMLLDQDEGVLAALAVSPLSAADYLAGRTLTLTGLAAAETVAVVWIGFGSSGRWHWILAGTVAMGALYTATGAVVATRYRSVNRLLLPASVLVAALLLPLLPHFGLAPRAPFLLHPLEPSLALMRAGYRASGPAELAYGLVGSACWAAMAFAWGRSQVDRLMRQTGTGEA